ncbi:MAG: rRNA small subunit methyltransferase H [Candidatus Jettenia ecosi]|uniref:Ribosomal RNA small subunit methyltransferase H n=1 Tax=Candidatus Jettenia ecosi TaxID=2494326 RepID=A0A533QDL0_9BACT|nr:MAG: rRNA small subunit methyltransferase H [Candidatus Jettenia ecosi]
MDDPVDNPPHIPVMVEEALNYLCLKPGQIILDGTVGSGGHASKIIERVHPNGLFIGIDKDLQILYIAKEYLSKISNTLCKFYHADYSDVDEVLRQAGVDKVHGVLLDLGASSLQFDWAERGFSFSKEGPLDMRMDRSRGVTVHDLIQRLSEKELEELLKKYGEERWSRRIARAILRAEKETGITSTRQLAAIIERIVPIGKSKIHPATRTFQALRIAVNRELDSLGSFLDKIHHYMFAGARIVIISFHSLEDRIVKNKFIEKANQGIFKILTKKPISPGEAEIEKNMRCRSAKLRAAERI